MGNYIGIGKGVLSEQQRFLSISRNLIKKELYTVPELYSDHDYKNRDTYIDGRFSSEQDPEFYKKLFEED